jgi:hypothetical protein
MVCLSEAKRDADYYLFSPVVSDADSMSRLLLAMLGGRMTGQCVLTSFMILRSILLFTSSILAVVPDEIPPFIS